MNPRGFKGRLNQPGIRNGILSGECATREFLAYLLDPIGFHGVPPTTLVEVDHPFYQKDGDIIKAGSLQVFVNHDDSVANYGSSFFPL
jgi:hypothetical protein